MAIESREGPLEGKTGAKLKVTCGQCDRPTYHTVVRSAEYKSHWQEGDFSVSGWDAYQVIECLGCATVSFRAIHQNSEDVDHDPDTGELVPNQTEELYPSRVAGRRELDNVLTLPAPIQRVYTETLGALRNALPVLAGIGIRALVETVCKDRQTRGRNLEERIDNLVTQGVLTQDGANILHSLRIMGNEAVHEVKPHSADRLNIAFDVVEYVLTGVYLLPAKAASLPQRAAT